MVERKIGYTSDPIFSKHTQSGHPERTQRLEAIIEELTTAHSASLVQQSVRLAADISTRIPIRPLNPNVRKAYTEI